MRMVILIKVQATLSQTVMAWIGRLMANLLKSQPGNRKLAHNTKTNSLNLIARTDAPLLLCLNYAYQNIIARAKQNFIVVLFAYLSLSSH